MRTVTTERLLAGVALRVALAPGLLLVPITGLAYDSRLVEPGFAFFAFSGANVDGRKFAGNALAQGASIVVSELPPPPDADEAMRAKWVEVEHGRHALAVACRNFYGPLSQQIPLVGITGTNGKTTTAFLVDSVLRAGGFRTALVGTIEYRMDGEARRAVNTTPDSLEMYGLLDELDLRRAGNRAAMTAEVSSHALDLGRVWGLQFHTAVFTNLTRDHLDYHGTMERYLAAKGELFRGQDAPPPAAAVINADDAAAAQLPVATSTRRWNYGFTAQANLRAEAVSNTFAGLRFQARTDNDQLIPIASKLVGRINVYNILAAVGVGLSFDLDAKVIAQGIADCTAVPGRFERVEAGQPYLAVVDYAHTDDALRNVLSVARELNPRKLIVVFGCGGDRDRAKRPLMGRAAAECADYVIVTSDNPRSEDPAAIINDALVGVQRLTTPHEAVIDRRQAIERALSLASQGDIVVIAGKGHETYQVFRDRTIHFDDREVVREILGNGASA